MSTQTSTPTLFARLAWTATRLLAVLFFGWVSGLLGCKVTEEDPIAEIEDIDGEGEYSWGSETPFNFILWESIGEAAEASERVRDSLLDRSLGHLELVHRHPEVRTSASSVARWRKRRGITLVRN